MNNFGRTVLALGLGTVMTFTNPECFFQAESEPTMVYAAEKATVQGRKLTVQSRSSISVRVSVDCLGKSESTTEVTTKKVRRLLPRRIPKAAAPERMNRRRIIRQKVRILRREAVHQVVRQEVQDQAVRHPEEILHQVVLYLEAVRQEVRHLRMAHRAAALQTMLRIRQSRPAVRHLGQMDRQIVIRIRHRIRILII